MQQASADTVSLCCSKSKCAALASGVGNALCSCSNVSVSHVSCDIMLQIRQSLGNCWINAAYCQRQASSKLTAMESRPYKCSILQTYTTPTHFSLTAHRWQDSLFVAVQFAEIVMSAVQGTVLLTAEDGLHTAASAVCNCIGHCQCCCIGDRTAPHAMP